MARSVSIRIAIHSITDNFKCDILNVNLWLTHNGVLMCGVSVLFIPHERFEESQF